ncbi:unnamed protein product [Prorocentrum cordatum]|uniref:Uncharacterized protein n=1 Tax=Prorocentrum cordatum TaxID=2364126 RepID=A0ABN9XJE7_9DINO|nr:unnamed protein product [Polarella glacialis]
MAVAAGIGATTAAGGLMGAAVYVCGCCDPLSWRRDAKVLPSIPEDADWCDIFCKARCALGEHRPQLGGSAACGTSRHCARPSFRVATVRGAGAGCQIAMLMA